MKFRTPVRIGLVVAAMMLMTHCAPSKNSKVVPPTNRNAGDDAQGNSPHSNQQGPATPVVPEDTLSGDLGGMGGENEGEQQQQQPPPDGGIVMPPSSGTGTPAPAPTPTPTPTPTPGSGSTPAFLKGSWMNCASGSQFTGITYIFGDGGSGIISKKIYTDGTCKTLAATQIGAKDSKFTFKVGDSIGTNTYKFDKTTALSVSITNYGAIMINGSSLYFDSQNDVAVTSKSAPGGSDATRATSINMNKTYVKQ